MSYDDYIKQSFEQDRTDPGRNVGFEAIFNILDTSKARLQGWDSFMFSPDPTNAEAKTDFISKSTLVDENGLEIEMPTGFDDFSPKADRNYSDCEEIGANNSRLLESLMEKHGFTGYYGEWWHYSDTTSYQVDHVFEPPVITE